MPIPNFNNQGVLPPYDGESAQFDNSSPYPATTFELCQMFGTTPERREILRGFLKFRGVFNDLLITEGFQWVDGRFMEKDPERGACPDCIQVVTFCKDGPRVNDPEFDEISAPIRAEYQIIRRQFRVDPFHVCLDWPLENVIANTRFYASLMSHQQETGIWKGMLEIKLGTPKDDAQAMEHLNSFGEV